MANEFQRAVLLAPDLVARAARSTASGYSTRWMLGQPRRVRSSYVAEVLEHEPGVAQDRAQQAWMLGQPDEVRRSYLEEVLRKGDEPPSPAVVWMLGQPQAVRHSYREQVMDAPDTTLKPQVQWMLRQPAEVRESYLREVIDAGG
jgi:hypothetical protein